MTDFTEFDGPGPAEPPPHGNGGQPPRGDLQSPHTAEGQGRRSSVPRVMTVRIEPTDDQWKFLRQRASEAAAYKNKHIQARLANALKWRVPEEDAARPGKLHHGKPVAFDIVKLVRERERGDLSSSTYVACESEVKKDWKRDGRKCMAGKALPQYRTAGSLGFASITGRPGARIVERGEGYAVELMVSGAHVEGGCWIEVPVSRRTARDEHRMPMLARMASGEIPITMARVVFRLHAGKTLLQLTYSIERLMPPMGQRTAVLSQLDDGRVLLRAGPHLLDYTSRVTWLHNLRGELDGVMRRCQSQIGRRKGHARLKRRLIARVRFEDRQNTHLHQWSREMADWLRNQGCGQLTVVGLVGGSWAAHKLMQMLAYKCDEGGIKVIEHGEFDDATVERAVKAAAAKAARKARKKTDAARTILQQE